MSDDATTALVSPLLDSREVAAYLKVSESTLSRWRADRKGPPYLRMGSIARYRLDQIDAWLESPSLMLLAESDRHWPELRRLVTHSKIGGPATQAQRQRALARGGAEKHALHLAGDQKARSGHQAPAFGPPDAAMAASISLPVTGPRNCLATLPSGAIR